MQQFEQLHGFIYMLPLSYASYIGYQFVSWSYLRCCFWPLKRYMAWDQVNWDYFFLISSACPTRSNRIGMLWVQLCSKLHLMSPGGRAFSAVALVLWNLHTRYEIGLITPEFLKVPQGQVMPAAPGHPKGQINSWDGSIINIPPSIFFSFSLAFIFFNVFKWL